MTVIGLTGPTGAGKSTACAAFAEMGALIVDADHLAREVVRVGSPCLAALTDTFGEDILQSDGSLDRAALAAKAFATAQATAALNAVTHPFIIARTRDILSQSKATVAVIDAALLFESGMDAMCDTTVAVLAPAEVRLARIITRDGLDRERAAARMNAQPNEQFYRDRAAHILLNDGDCDALHQAATALAKTLFSEVVGWLNAAPADKDGG